MSKLGALKPLAPLVRRDSQNIKTQNPPNLLTPSTSDTAGTQPEEPQEAAGQDFPQNSGNAAHRTSLKKFESQMAKLPGESLEDTGKLPEMLPEGNGAMTTGSMTPWSERTGSSAASISGTVSPDRGQTSSTLDGQLKGKPGSLQPALNLKLEKLLPQNGEEEGSQPVSNNGKHSRGVGSLKKQASGNSVLSNERRNTLVEATEIPHSDLIAGFCISLINKTLSEPLYRQLSRVQSKTRVTPSNSLTEGPSGMQNTVGKFMAPGKFMCGKLTFEKSKQDIPAQYFKVPSVDSGGNAHLMRFIAERVWHLERPDVLMTVTGGADDFDLPLDQKDDLLQGLVSVAKHMNAWIITGGTDAGIMKYVGEARARYAAHVPLIGVAAWGVVQGRHHLNDMDYRDVFDMDNVLYDKAAEQHFEECQRKKRQCECGGAPRNPTGCAKCKSNYLPKVRLNHNHTHFFLVDDGQEEGHFGREIDTRASFEAIVSGSENHVQNVVELVRSSPSWGLQHPTSTGSGMNLRDEAQSGAAKGFFELNQEIPSVCVCVQGGPGSVSTVLSTAQSSTPVFLVKGSGKAADLIADLVILKMLEDDPNVQLQTRKPHPILLDIINKCEEYMDLESESTGQAPKQVKKELTLANSPGPSSPHTKKEQPTHQPKVGFVEEKQLFEIPVQVLQELAGSLEKSSFKHKAKQSGKTGLINGSFATSGKNFYSQTHDQRNPASENDQDQTADSDDFHANRKKEILEELLEILYRSYMHYYGTSPRSRRECVQIFRNAMRAAATDMCWAYDLGYNQPDAGDFFGTLLRCLINGMGREDHHNISARGDARALQTHVFLQKLMMAIRWNRCDVLRHTMDSTKLSNSSQAYIDAVNLALPLTLNLNHVDHAKLLLAHGASLNQYLYPQDESPAPDVDERWKHLLSACKTNMTLHHMMMLIDETSMYMPKMFQKEAEETDNYYKRRLERVYKLLLGDAFQYEMGMRGPELDLLLWSGLMNRPEMAKFFWIRSGQPVLNALTMCMLFRRLAARPDITPVIMKEMLQSAQDFEELALGVQTIAMHEDMTVALDALENPSLIWDDMRLLDVAVHGNCEKFIEGCCREALDRRFAGDLMPYGQCVGPLRGLKKSCAVCLLTLGFGAPYLLKYNAPPKASNVRFPTQRRKVPIGYPFDVDANPVLSTSKKEDMKSTTRNLLARLTTEGSAAMDTMNNDDLGELWTPTFTYWERFALFWSSPVVIFTANGMVQCLALLLFTDWMIRTYRENQLQAFDYIFAVFFGASVTMECMELFLTGFTYFTSFWNMLDVGAAGLYFLGLYLKVHCIDAPDECTQFLWTASLAIQKLNKAYYSACLGLLWARFLRIFAVNKAVGPLVIMVRKMGKDLLKFGLVWTVMWIAFAIVMNGSVDDFEDENCGTDLQDYTCTTWWFFVRTFFQAMGEPMLIEHRTDASVITLVFLFIIMNVVLLNLLIAIMSNTYQDVQLQSNRKFLMDLYEVSEDYSRISLGMPLPFNVLFLVFDFFGFIRYTLDGTFDLLYPDCGFRERFQKHLSTNSTQVQERLELAKYTAEHRRVNNQGHIIKTYKVRGQEAYYQWRTDAFMENAKSTYIDRCNIGEEVRETYEAKVRRSVLEHVKRIAEQQDEKMKEIQATITREMEGMTEKIRSGVVNI